MANRDRLAAYFTARPLLWIDARQLQIQGGALAWRTRVSDCRLDLHMTIENKLTRHGFGVTSWYRYVPWTPIGKDAGTAREASLF